MTKEPNFLCTWDFCKSCIDFRVKNKLKIPKLRKHEKQKAPHQGVPFKIHM